MTGTPGTAVRAISWEVKWRFLRVYRTRRHSQILIGAEGLREVENCRQHLGSPGRTRCERPSAVEDRCQRDVVHLRQPVRREPLAEWARSCAR